MKIEQTRWMDAKGWQPDGPGRQGLTPQFVLLFGDRHILGSEKIVGSLRAAYPEAHFAGCSTGGEICGASVTDGALVATAIEFDHTRVQVAATPIRDSEDSFDAGKRLAQFLPHGDLIHVLVLTEGIFLNGSKLVQGMTQHLPEKVSITGGLAGDGTAFKETLLLWDDQTAKEAVVAVGFYGDRLKVGYGSLGGWDPFGPERRITRSKGNVLYELDGKSALELYKLYLGEEDAKRLPSSGVLFPLSVRDTLHDTALVRTVWSINEADQSMTFTGDLPDGGYARLMKANFNRLIDGAMDAARISCEALGSVPPDLAILISCVGRKMVLKQRTEEEVEGVREVMGERTVLAGFYSNGEISPFRPHAKCEHHNQTMTITTFREA
jgi:hypothetical protein